MASIYSRDQITQVTIYSGKDDVEHVAYGNKNFIIKPSDIPSVKQYLELIELSRTNETVRIHLEQLLVIYGLLK